jgi:hypothetical protein
MKSVIRRAMLAVAGVLAFSAAAQAETIEVKVPFAFLVGEQKLPAGDYRIERDASMPSSVVLIRGEHGTAARLFVQTVSLSGVKPAGEKPALVFVPDETGFRLTQVWGTAAIGQELQSAF